MKAEYAKQGARQSLRDARWYQEARLTQSHPQHISAGKKMAGPYIWHVKDEEPPAVKRSVQKFWHTPYFLNETANRLEAWDSFEFWFSLPGGGSFAHADAYCEMTMSAQFSGRKNWRLMMYPETNTIFDSFDSFDAGIYREGKWKPEYDFEVGPGQCFIFPPGYVHETYVHPKDNDQCAVASTFQMNIPFPVRYIRAFLPRFFSTHLVWEENCHERWYSFHTFSDEIPKVTSDDAELLKRVERIFRRVDQNKDRQLSRDEVSAFLNNRPWARDVYYSWLPLISQEEREEVIDSVVASRTDDTIAYNDLDEDGLISVDELLGSTVQWNVLMARQRLLKKSRSSAEMQEIEMKFHKQYRCHDAASEECAVELERIKNLDKNKHDLPVFQKEGIEFEHDEL